MDPLAGQEDGLNGNHGIPSPQFAILNYFFPGYSVLIATLNTSLGADFNQYLPFIIAAAAIALSWRYVTDTIMNLIEANFMSSFTVRTDDETYNILMWWMTRQPFSQKTRNFVVNTSIYSRSDYLWRRDVDDEDANMDEEEQESAGGSSSLRSDSTAGGNLGFLSPNRGKHVLHYTPSSGSHWFWYKGRPLRFSRRQTKDQINLRNPSEQEELCVSCLGRRPRILKQLLGEARLLYLSKDDRKTIIYRATSSVSSYGTDAYWQRCMSRPNRDFSTVILPDTIKSDIIADAADYLEPATRRWYANRGIPYRRGYLLYGPPGTGKSSLSVALAGYFRMKIYIVSLSSLTATEENLASLFAELPTNCIVLLEDIDTAGLSSTREASKDAKKNKDEADSTGSNSNNAPAHGQLSLSALLNILDGVAAQEGRVLIMTTNHLESLDKALIRPGRVDMIIPFQLADTDMSESIFKAIYAPYDGEHHEGAPSTDKEKKTRIDEVEVLAKEFARRIPSGEFSPAEIQGLLLRHKRSSQAAVDAVPSWVAQMRQDKKDKEEQDRKDKEEKEKKEKDRKEKEEKETEEQDKKDKKKKKQKREKKEQEEKRKKEDNEDGTDDVDDDEDETDDEDEKEEKDKQENEKAKVKKKKNETAATTTGKEKSTRAVTTKEGNSQGSSDSGYATP